MDFTGNEYSLRKKNNMEHYLLSPILDHKERYDLNGTEIIITKDWENNLRSRNCQLGIVEGLSETNPLGLCLGDVVFVNHFTFHGDIGADRSFTLNVHADHEETKIFKVPIRNIYFKYNDKKIEPIGKVLIVEQVLTPDHSEEGLTLIQSNYKDRGKVIYAKDTQMVGKIVLVDTNALYALELKDYDYYKIFDSEVVGYFEKGELYPYGNRVLLEDQEEERKHDILDLSQLKNSRTVKAKVIRKGSLSKHLNFVNEGDTVVRFRNYGISDKKQVIVAMDEDNIHAVVKGEGIENLKLIS